MGILFTILSALFSAVYFIIVKSASDKSKNHSLTPVLLQFVCAIFYVPLFAFDQVKISFAPEALQLILIVSIIYAAASYYRIISNKHIDASIGVVISRLALVTSFIGAIFVFKETFQINRGIGVLLVIIGILVLALNKKVMFKRFDTSAILMAAGAAVLFGIGSLLDGKGMDYYSASFYACITTVIPGFMIMGLQMTKRTQFKDYWAEFSHNYKRIIITAIFGDIGYFFMLRSFSYLDKSLAIPLVNMNMAFVIILSMVFLGERDHIKKKILSVLLIFIGIIFISLK